MIVNISEEIIIDTHIFLSALSEPDKLGDKKRKTLQALYNTSQSPLSLLSSTTRSNTS